MLKTRKPMVSWQAFPSLLPRAPLAFLSRLNLPFPKLPFPSLSNACHAGYPYTKVGNYMTHPLVFKHGFLVQLKPCSVHDKISWYIATTNIKITDHTSHWKYKCERPNISCFDGRYESWHKYTAKRGGIKIIFKAYENFYRQPIPTHYLPEMVRLILKKNFFHFNGKHYLQTHGTAMGTKTAVSVPLPTFSWHILKQQL